MATSVDMPLCLSNSMAYSYSPSSPFLLLFPTVSHITSHVSWGSDLITTQIFSLTASAVYYSLLGHHWANGVLLNAGFGLNEITFGIPVNWSSNCIVFPHANYFLRAVKRVLFREPTGPITYYQLKLKRFQPNQQATLLI